MEPLQNKNAETVGRATKRATQELTGDDKNFVVTTDERGEELQPSVRRRAAAGGRGLHDRPQHGGSGDPAEAAGCRRQRGGPADETGQAGGCEAAGRLPGSEAQDHRLASFENDKARPGLLVSEEAWSDPFWRKKKL